MLSTNSAKERGGLIVYYIKPWGLYINYPQKICRSISSRGTIVGTLPYHDIYLSPEIITNVDPINRNLLDHKHHNSQLTKKSKK